MSWDSFFLFFVPPEKMDPMMTERKFCRGVQQRPFGQQQNLLIDSGNSPHRVMLVARHQCSQFDTVLPAPSAKHSIL